MNFKERTKMKDVIQIKQDIEFVIKLVQEVAEKRNYEDAVIRCRLIFMLVEEAILPDNEKEIINIKTQLINLIDDIEFIIKTERRYVLFPLADIKKEAYEIGKKYMENFLDWVKPENNYTPEQLMGVLEDELYRLDEAKEIILNMNKNHQTYK